VAYQPPANLPPPLEAVTDLPAAYEALRERIRQTEQEIARISSVLSHDLRAQLRSIDAFREFVLEDAAACLDDESRENLERIGVTVQGVDHLVERVVLLQRLPRQPLQLRDVPLATVLDPTLRRMADTFRALSVDVALAGVSLDDVVRADAPRASEALYQLLENAAVFRPTGDVSPIRLDVLRDDANAVVLRVTDLGIGMETGDFEVVFEPGRRLNGPRAYPGAGLGLYLARRLLEGWARGPVVVTSALGLGSTFEMALPAA
jgi:signal transduction histidine kinase